MREVVLVLLGVGVGGEGGLAVVDEDLRGAAVDEDAELLQLVLQGHVQDLEDVLVEALVQAPAVQGADLRGGVIVQGQAAGAVGLGEEGQVEVALRDLDLQLAGVGQDPVVGLLRPAEGLDAGDGGSRCR